MKKFASIRRMAGVITQIEPVEHGNLTPESSAFFGKMFPLDPQYYPLGHSWTKPKPDGGHFGKLVDVPMDSPEAKQWWGDDFAPEFIFQSVEDAFNYYCHWIMEEHEDLPDAKFVESPTGIFLGRGRNARWYDEARRREVV
jgi:hypothetical protein